MSESKKKRTKTTTTAYEPLGDSDKQRIASLILQVCQLCDGTMGRRIDDMLDALLWSYNVDGRSDGNFRKDRWLPARGELTMMHAERVPCSAAAREAIANSPCSAKVRREHVVPRKMLKKVVRKIKSVERMKTILDKYCIVVLVTKAEEARVQADTKSKGLARQMPKDWGKDVNWTDAPVDELPTAWQRYIDARIVLYQHGKTVVMT